MLNGCTVDVLVGYKVCQNPRIVFSNTKERAFKNVFLRNSRKIFEDKCFIIFQRRRSFQCHFVCQNVLKMFYVITN
jgi:hypothetical protein